LPTPSLHFGPSQRFELQPTERRLLVDGQVATLGGRAFDLLLTLLEQPGRLRSKDELLAAVWPGLVVEEANLQMQVSNLRKLLGADMISTVPGRGYRFVGEVTAAEVMDFAKAAGDASGTAPPRPATPRLFGRDDDMSRLQALLQAEGAVVTLVGSAGVGKTSLARAAAARWRSRHGWVDLAALAPGHPIAAAVARALGLQLGGDDHEAPARLVAALQGQALLLVLDNAEHLVETCAALVSQWAALPGIRCLVTSQVPLAVAGEQVQRLEPLAWPDDGADLGDGALALLVARIAAADHRFAPTPATLPLLRAICTQLDGLPLALEMAAARVPMLGLQTVHDALAQRFALLTRGHRDSATRHRTLHNAVDWSYRLLQAEEQALFRALSVFASGFTLELALALLADEKADDQADDARWAVIDGLCNLAERSLVVVGPEDPPRYRLLETLRAFAWAQPGAPEDHHRLQRRHARALCDLFGRYVVGDAPFAAVCLDEMANARDALAWAQRHDLALAAQLSLSITTVTTFTVWRHESGHWLLALEPLMDQPAGRALPAALQAAWWTERARIGVIRQQPRANTPARRAVDLWRMLQQSDALLRAMVTWVRSIAAPGAELDEACAALQAQSALLPDLPVLDRLRVQGALTYAAMTRGDSEAAIAGREAEIVLARALGDHHAADAAESAIVNQLLGLKRFAEAAARGQALLARVDADGSGRNGNLPWVMYGVVMALVQSGRWHEAGALLPRALAAGRRFSTPVVVSALPTLAAADGRWADAAQLVGHARRVYAAQGLAQPGAAGSPMAAALAAASEALGAEPVAALVAQGHSLDDAAAEALALGGDLKAALAAAAAGPAPAAPTR
jgi:non-specific serine/threonine protein kinase